MAYSNPRQNINHLGEVLPLFAGLIFTALVYLVAGDFLFTLAGSIAGLLGIQGYVSYATSRIKSVGAVIGGTVGAIVDGYSNFSGAVLSGMFSGDLACLIWMMGYCVLFGVILYNYIFSGKLVR